MTFEKHLSLVSRAASHRLRILRMYWRVFHDRSLLERCFWGFVLPVLEYCSAVWCSAADTHLKLLDYAVSGRCVLTGVCLSVTLFIVNLLHICVDCIRSGVTRCTCLMMRYLDVCASTGYTRCPGRTSVYLCAVSLQNLAVPHDFFSPLSILLERSC